MAKAFTFMIAGDGRMMAPRSLSGFVSVQYDFTDSFSMTALYSQAYDNIMRVC